MRKIFVRGIGIKLLLFLIFYLWDLDLGSSVSYWDSDVLNSWNGHNNYLAITNELSDIKEFKSLEEEIGSILNKYEIIGASIALAKDGKLVFAKGIGYADLENSEIVEPYHLFRIASVSKLITAVTIMNMSDRGLLNLDQRVFGIDGILNDSIYLEYLDHRVESITIRHLLNHSAGWNRRFGDHMFMSHIISRETNSGLPVCQSDIIRFALSKRLHFTPGSGTSYSNLGYAILGEVIESISGISYEDYVQQTILLPLGIKGMKIGKNLIDDRFDEEVIYYEQDNALMVNSVYNIEEMVPKSYGGNDIEVLGAAGGWIASPTDLLRLIVAIDYNNNIPNIISRESISLMIDTINGGRNPIGWTNTDRHGNWRRTGSFAGTSAVAVRQGKGLSWAVFLNTSTYKGSAIANEISLSVRSALRNLENWPEHDLFYHIYSSVEKP